MTAGVAVKPALVVLAAGLGSRYRSDKQITGVGPNGEWLLEYSIHDALAAGFAQIVLVVRAEIRAALSARLAPLLSTRAPLHLIEQAIDHVPAGCKAPLNRSKPLGTGHALWCAAPLLHGPFAVINADDYYGREAYTLLARHFGAHAGPAMVGYPLSATLSPHGAVNRGVCAIDGHGHLASVVEYTAISEHAGALVGSAPDGSRHSLPTDTVVSLNCWGLTANFLPSLDGGLRDFLAHAGAADEYFLPRAIDAYLAASGQPLSVLRGGGPWLGMTYPDDRPRVAAAIAALHAEGHYSTPLWAQFRSTDS